MLPASAVARRALCSHSNRKDLHHGVCTHRNSRTAKYFSDINASFDNKTGILTIKGGSKADFITVSKDAAGVIQIDVGAGKLKYKPTGATIANTDLIKITGEKGNDVITLDESSGP